MKMFLIVMTFLEGSLAFSGQAINSYTTNRGVTFTRVNGTNFENAWKAPNGVTWTSCLGNFQNKGESAPPPAEFEPVLVEYQRALTNSDATQACEAKGARLPVYNDYDVLYDLFFPMGNRTKVDQQDFLTLFPDCNENDEPKASWTGTGRPTKAFAAYQWRVLTSPLISTELLAVRCVIYPPIADPIPAKTSYTTSTGSLFTQVTSGAFANGWRDPAGLVWSIELNQHAHALAIPVPHGSENLSPALHACLDKGGQLPTLEDYLRLEKYFDLVPDESFTDPLRQPRQFTNKGFSDFFNIFPQARNKEFWTSTPGSESPDFFGTTVIFQLYKDGTSFGTPGGRDLTDVLPVMCISESSRLHYP